LHFQEAGKLKGKSKFIELAVQKSGTIFTTRTLKGLSEEHNDLTTQYEKQQRSLVKEVVAIAGQSLPCPSHIRVALIFYGSNSIVYSDPRSFGRADRFA
jgi:predicted aldo/keto reductase-like oxidoreductase